MMRTTLQRVTKGLFGAGLLAVAAIGAAPAAFAESFTGAFLAARHAEVEQDVSAAAKYYNRALRLKPSAVELLDPALYYTVASGDLLRGVALAERVIAREPDNAVARLTLAVDAFAEGRYADARAHLDAAGEDAATGLLATLISAWGSYGEGDAEAAVAALTAPEERILFQLFLRYHGGLAATLAGDPETAVTAFEEAIEAAGGATARVALALGAALEMAGRADEAAVQYAAALERDPTDPGLRAAQARLQQPAEERDPPTAVVETAIDGAAEALYGLGAALAQDEGARFALLYGQLALRLKPDFDEANLLIGEVFESVDQYEAADDAYARVPDTSPHYNFAQLGRAAALGRLERDDEALATMRSLSAREPDDANVYFAIGEFLSRRGRFDECVDAYDSGVQRLEQTTERHWVVYYGRGICLERTGDWDRAEENFVLALELRPDQPDVLNYLGYSLVEQGRRLDEAREMIERAVAERPSSGYIVDSLGWVLYRLGDFDGAVTHLEEAARLSPVEPVIIDHLGDALWMVGRKLEARFQWKRALSFEPEEDVEARILRKLDVGLDRVLADEAEEAEAAEAVEPTESDNTEVDASGDVTVAPEQGG